MERNLRVPYFNLLGNVGIELNFLMYHWSKKSFDIDFHHSHFFTTTMAHLVRLMSTAETQKPRAEWRRVLHFQRVLGCSKHLDMCGYCSDLL